MGDHRQQGTDQNQGSAVSRISGLWYAVALLLIAAVAFTGVTFLVGNGGSPGTQPLASPSLMPTPSVTPKPTPVSHKPTPAPTPRKTPKPKPKPKPKPAPKPVRKATRVIIVQPGQTLWTIAAQYLGSALKWQQIYNMNRAVIGTNPNLIFAGQHLRL